MSGETYCFGQSLGQDTVCDAYEPHSWKTDICRVCTYPKTSHIINESASTKSPTLLQNDTKPDPRLHIKSPKLTRKQKESALIEVSLFQAEFNRLQKELDDQLETLDNKYTEESIPEPIPEKSPEIQETEIQETPIKETPTPTTEEQEEEHVKNIEEIDQIVEDTDLTKSKSIENFQQIQETNKKYDLLQQDTEKLQSASDQKTLEIQALKVQVQKRDKEIFALQNNLEKEKESKKPMTIHKLSKNPSDGGSQDRIELIVESIQEETSQRKLIAREVLETEKTFVNGLQIMVHDYMLALIEVAEEKKIKAKQIRTLFSNVEYIYETNSVLLKLLAQTIETDNDSFPIGAIFSTFAPLLKPYGVYGSNYNAAVECYSDIMQNNPLAAEFFQSCDAKSQSGLFLKDYLIMPVQRIPRYNLLLAEILKCTVESHRDYQSLQLALKQTKAIADYINEQIRGAENSKQFSSLIENSEFAYLQQKGRFLNRFGPLTVLLAPLSRLKDSRLQALPIEPLEFYLFNDILICPSLKTKKAKDYEYQCDMQLTWINVGSDTTTQKEENTFTLTTPGGNWLLKAMSSVDKEDWLAAISRTIETIVRIDDATIPLRTGMHEVPDFNGTYTGGWRHATFHGRGKLTQHDEGFSYDGYWDTDLKSGYGKIRTIATGELVTGGWFFEENKIKEENPESESNDFTERDWALLLTGSKETVYGKNKFILEEGKTNDALFRILDGEVRVEKKIDGKKTVVAKMEPPAIFGEQTVLDPTGPATASIIATGGSCSIQVIQLSFLYELFKINPGISKRFHKRLALQLAERLRTKTATKSETQAVQGDQIETLTKSKKDLKKEKKAQRRLSKIQDKSRRKLAKEGSSKTLETEKDAAFSSLFKFKTDEVVIHEYFVEFLDTKFNKAGKLYVSKNYLCFYAKVFGSKTKLAISYVTVVGIVADIEQKMILVTVKEKSNEKKVVFSFSNAGTTEDAYRFISSIWSSSASSKAISESISSESLSNLSEDDDLMDKEKENEKETEILTAQDWSQILESEAVHQISYSEDDYVIMEDSHHFKIFQIASGKCRIEKKTDSNEKIVLGTMEEGDLFGEISFLEGGSASASIVVEKPNTQIYVIEGYYLNCLLVRYPALGGRFYHYLANVLSKRLRERGK